MRYIKNPLAITVIASGICILGAALAGSAKYPWFFYSMCAAWVALAVVSVIILRRRHERP